MTERPREYERWTRLRDRAALGESLSGEEEAFCERFESEHPAAALELAILDELAALDASPNAESGALVDSVLATLQAEKDRPLALPRRAPAAGRYRSAVWATLAAACAALAVWQLDGDPTPQASEPPLASLPPARVELVYSSGEVRVDGVTPALTSGLLAEGSVLEAGQGGACLALDPDIDVCLGEASRARLERIGGEHRALELLEGRVAVHLAHQPRGMRFSIVANGVWSTAIGTKYTVALAPEGVRTTVLEGAVQVGHEHEGRLVRAHQQSTVLAERATLSPISRAAEAPEWALLEPTELWQDRVAATIDLRGAPDGAAVRLDEQRIGIAPLASLIPAGRHVLEVHVDGRATMKHAFEVAAGETRVIEYVAMARAQTPEALPAAPRPAAPGVRHGKAQEPLTTRTASDLLREARQALRDQQWGAAAYKYEQIVERFSGTAEAHTVLVPLGQLQLDHLDRPDLSLRNLQRYLDQGSGSLAQEARHSRIRALRELGDTHREASAIESYLADYPASFQAKTLQARLSRLRSSE